MIYVLVQIAASKNGVEYVVSGFSKLLKPNFAIDALRMDCPLVRYEVNGGSADIPTAYRQLARATAIRALARGLLTDVQVARILEILATDPEGTP